MKRQQLFYSFLPGVTAAVLTTQPALAGVMKVNGVQPASSPSVLATTTNSQSLVGDKIQTQLPNAAVMSFPDLVPDNRFTTLNVKSLSSNSIPVILTGNTVVPIEQRSQKDEVRFLSLAPTSNSLSNQKQSNFATSGQQSKKIFVPTSISKLASARKATLSLSSLRQSETLNQNPETQLPTVLQTAVRGVGTAKLLETQSCSREKESLAAVLIAARNCQNQKIAGNLLAQSSISTPVDSQTTPIQPATTIPPAAGSQTTPIQPATTIPPAAGSQTTPIQPATTIPPASGAVQVPDNLITNPNLLQFPTKPEEVTLQENQAITLAQALELARRNNRDLQVSVLELERTKSALREAQAALLPTVGLTADVTRSRSAANQLSLETQAQQTGIPTPDNPATTNFTGQAQLSYDIYTSGKRQATIKQAEEQVRFNELAVESKSEDIRLNVNTDYYNLQQADEQVRISKSAVQNSQASLRDAQALERAGVGTRFDVLRSEVNLANATQNLTKALSNQEISRRTLATRLSLPQRVNISAADPVELAGLWNQSLEQSIVLAFQNRSELQQQLAQRNISEQQRRQALASLGPQVSLVANYNLLDQFDDNVSAVDGYSVGVRATLSLYDGGAARARAAQAKTNITIAETNFAEQRNQIRFQVEQAFSTKDSNLKNVQTANTALEQAREALRLARLRFQAGVGTQTDVINSENDLTQSEGNRITAILDYNRALAQLQRAISSRALR